MAAAASATVLIPLAHHGSSGGELRAIAPVLGNHILQSIVLCAFFLFARFRFADIFIRYSVRILLAGGLATVVAITARLIMLAQYTGGTVLTPAFHVFGITVLGAILMLAFAFADAPISRQVNRWMFHSPDYRGLTRQLGETLRGLDSEPEIAHAAEIVVRRRAWNWRMRASSGARRHPADRSARRFDRRRTGRACT